MTGQARAALEDCDVVVGYRTYIELVGPILTDQEIVSSAMTHEIERAGTALDLAAAGRRVALISSGDPGVYAMAAVVFELVRDRDIHLGSGPGRLDLRVVPGVAAVTAAAALLGAPLSHDFACVSLSDRLTPWEVIARRLDLAARADFVIALYNPKSKGRNWQFARALEIVGRHRGPETVVGLVGRAMRLGQSVKITDLAHAAEAEVDMQSLVIIGNSHSFRYGQSMVTPRGYLNKYGRQDEGD